MTWKSTFPVLWGLSTYEYTNGDINYYDDICPKIPYFSAYAFLHYFAMAIVGSIFFALIVVAYFILVKLSKALQMRFPLLAFAASIFTGRGGKKSPHTKHEQANIIDNDYLLDKALSQLQDELTSLQLTVCTELQQQLRVQEARIRTLESEKQLKIQKEWEQQLLRQQQEEAEQQQLQQQQQHQQDEEEQQQLLQ